MRGRLQVDVVGSDDEPRIMSLNASAVMRATLRVDPELEGEVDQERLGFGILPGEVVPYNWMPATVARTPLFPNATPGRGRRVLAEVALPAGRYRIQPLTGNQAAYVSSMRFNGREIVDGAFDMGIQDGVLEVTFSGPGGTIRGVAQDASGNRIANRQVVLLPAAAGSSLTEPRVIPTDNGGSFEFSRIPPGTYSIVAVENMQENAYLDSEFVRRHAAELVSIRIENGAVNTVQLDVVGVTP
jgi:hypothetical protein